MPGSPLGKGGVGGYPLEDIAKEYAEVLKT